MYEIGEFSGSLKKPGKKKKGKIKNGGVRLHKIDLPEKKHCRRCGVETGTEAIRHAEATYIKALSGCGIGMKIHDRLSALLCYDCDAVMSTKPDRDAPEVIHLRHAVEWWELIAKTWLL